MIKSKIGVVETDPAKYFRITNLAYFVSGLTEIVWACGDSASSVLFVG